MDPLHQKKVSTDFLHEIKYACKRSDVQLIAAGGKAVEVVGRGAGKAALAREPAMKVTRLGGAPRRSDLMSLPGDDLLVGRVGGRERLRGRGKREGEQGDGE